MRNRRVTRMFGCLGTIGVAALLVGCPQESDTRTASLSFTGLEPLGEGFTYEGWLVQGNDAVSAGRFNIDADGNASPATSTVSLATADAATAFVVTIEPTTDDEPGPSNTKVLAGDLTEGAADLTVSHPAALGSDFGPTAASGAYILATPTTAPVDDVDDDFAQGIWWLDPGDPPTASLVLPTLPDGWIYEGWIVGDDGPVSTGRFTAVDAADDDGAGTTAGPEDAPPFPGQDFIDPPTVLTAGGVAAVISVEPVPDDGPGPFAIKPLVDPEIEDFGAGGSQSMENNSATLPTGSVVIE